MLNIFYEWKDFKSKIKDEDSKLNLFPKENYTKNTAK